MINATSTGTSNYKPIDAGTYAARCYSMVHIGTVTESIMGIDKELNKVRITWELPTEMKVFKEENGQQPSVVSKEFTLSLHEKSTLRKFLQSWRGKAFTEEEAKCFDISLLLAKPCLISIIHKEAKNGNIYAEIASVSTLPKGMECPPLINDLFEFTINEFDQFKFDMLPDFLKEKVKTSKEFKALQTNISHEEVKQEEETDDLPF